MEMNTQTPEMAHVRPERREAWLGNATVRYEVAGEGEPLVLVHGLSGSTRWWARNIPALAAHYRVHPVDLPGFGGLRRLRKDFALVRAADWMQRWMDAVGLERAHLIGHSMGGLVGIRFAARYPQRVRRLVLAAPASLPTGASLAGQLLPLATALRYATPSFLPVLAYDALRAGPATLLRAARDILHADVRADLRAIAAPTLLLWGERDALVPPSIGPLLRGEIPDARLLLIPGAGHVLMWDRPRAFDDAVLAFLAGEPVGE